MRSPSLISLLAFALLLSLTASAQPIVYKDAQTLITGTWASASSTLTEVTGETPFEGNKHYKFVYNVSGWWAGLGLNMDNWGNGPARDFSGYTHLRIAYRGLAGSQHLYVKLRNGNTYSNTVDIGPTAGAYTVVEVPMIALTAGTNLNVNAVREMDMDVGGVQTGSGTVYFDAIELVNLSSGSPASAQTWARANALTLGINTSNWLEAYWLIPFGAYPEFNRYTRTKIRDLHTAGFQVFRLPVIFERLAASNSPYTINFNQPALQLVDSMILWANIYNLKLILDNHHGYDLTDANYSGEIPRLRSIWGQITDHYNYLNPDKFFFEIYNEPTPSISNANWRTVATELLEEIRMHETQTHSVFVGANSWNGASALVGFTPLDDADVIYTFHSYDPYAFTHQGMSWTTPPYLPARAFPLSGEVAAINTMMQGVDDWSVFYDVPASLGEFGCSTAADAGSRCNWIQTFADAINAHGYSHLYWDAITPSDAFGFFTGGIIDQAHVIPCFSTALNLYQPLPIALEQFSVLCLDGKPQLHWSANVVGQGYWFAIERSDDGKSWEHVSDIPAKEAVSIYSFIDAQLGAFYRLNMVSPDGGHSYSPIQAANCAKLGVQVQIYPNPASGMVTIHSLRPEAYIVGIKLFDLAGRELALKGLDAADHQKQVHFSVAGLPSGIYILRGQLADGTLWHQQLAVNR